MKYTIVILNCTKCEFIDLWYECFSRECCTIHKSPCAHQSYHEIKEMFSRMADDRKIPRGDINFVTAGYTCWRCKGKPIEDPKFD